VLLNKEEDRIIFH